MPNISAGEAFAKRLDELADTGVKGFHARVSYLTKSEAGQQAMIGAGIDLNNRSTRRTVLGWLSDPESIPSSKYLRAVDEAYANRRRQTMANSLKKRLGNNGQGTQIEVYPRDQSAVDAKRQRALDVRRVNLRPSQWDEIINAWSEGDILGMDAAWADIASEVIGSDWGAFLIVTHIGF